MTNVKRLAETVVSYLKARGELSSLPEVIRLLQKADGAVNRSSRAVVTSAYQLGAAELREIEAYIKKSTGAALPLENVVDPSLVAGFTLRLGDTFLDSSVKGKLQSLTAELAK